MAIIQEEYYIKDRKMIRTYSDENRYVVRDGISYSKACDPAEFGRTYTEGDVIPEPEEVEDENENEILDMSNMELVN